MTAAILANVSLALLPCPYRWCLGECCTQPTPNYYQPEWQVDRLHLGRESSVLTDPADGVQRASVQLVRVDYENPSDTTGTTVELFLDEWLEDPRSGVGAVFKPADARSYGTALIKLADSGCAGARADSTGESCGALVSASVLDDGVVEMVIRESAEPAGSRRVRMACARLWALGRYLEMAADEAEVSQ